ncbi:hypothetical protein RSOLAG1IB_06799 [Rhizoctonia solani AG-1 IB]|uniref:DUF6535 domain-containing protein n=1 Tax=Thanatephorus cucumeris (strain AG1-IB / isolate 7/3/14) TaxID=1108050 RepID=A0A0B7FB26_THACB|nr:hypothetical protein RSOLAG1IB_06799 [Rhizoctonia solani AG-1 IB]
MGVRVADRRANTPAETIWLYRHRLLKLQTPIDHRASQLEDEYTVPHDQQRIHVINQFPSQYNRTRAFEQMRTDKPGEELSDNAAIWDLYLEEAQDYDNELVKGRQASLDTLLIFAALFSAIQTAFLIESKDLLQQDSADVSASLLLFIAQSQQRIELGVPLPPAANISLPDTGFQPTAIAQWINGIWFISLGLSLSVTLITMLSKEWLTAYLSSRPRPAHKHALLRQARLEGLQGWWALHIMALLPSFIHLSLLLFALGLVLYLVTLNGGIAIAFGVGVGIVLAFDVLTIVCAAIYSTCPFVTEASNYLKKILDLLRGLRQGEKTQEGEVQAPENILKDIQALLWLANHSRDPTIVDCSYQAMAGLRRLLNIQSQTKPTTPANAMAVVQTILPIKLNKGTTSNDLLSIVVDRFVNLLDGNLELPHPEAIVDRHVHAMIAIRTGIPVSPVISWLQLLGLIERVGHSNIASGSISPNSFANLLIAEMQVINLALRDLENVTQQTPLAQIGLLTVSLLGGLMVSSEVLQTDPPLTTLRKSANRWLQLVSLILAHQSNGKILLDSYLLIELLSSMKDAVQPRLLNPLQQGSSAQTDLPAPVEFMTPFAYRAPVLYHSQDLSASPLGSIVAILSLPLANSDDLQLRLNQSAIAAYSSLAPVILARVLGRNDQLDTEFVALGALKDIKLSSLEESMYIIVHCMMLTLNCLLKKRHGRLILRVEDLKRFFPLLAAILALVADCVAKDRRLTTRGTGALNALGEHLPILNELLDDQIVSRRWAEEQHPRVVKSIIIIATYAIKDNLKFTNNFISPSKLPVLVRLVVEASPAPDYVDPMLEAMASLLNPIQLFSSDFSTECLQEFIGRPKNFLALMKLASKRKDSSSVWAIVVYIISLAADINVDTSSFDLHADVATSDVEDRQVIALLLDTVNWALEYQNTTSPEKKASPEFFLGSANLMVAIHDSASRYQQLITEHSAYQCILSDLHTMSSNGTAYWVARYQKVIEELTGGLFLV